MLKNIDLSKYNSFTIICGVGNNGGDGLAVGRHLIVNDKKVRIFTIGNINKGSKDFNTNYNILKNMGIEIKHIDTEEDINMLIDSLKSSDIAIDSIFGTGLSRDVKDLYRDVISAINDNSKYILSIDVPSGMDSDTGDVLGICIKANKTVTMQLMKKGLVNNPDYTGEVIVEPIGMPKMAIDEILNR